MIIGNPGISVIAGTRAAAGAGAGLGATVAAGLACVGLAAGGVLALSMGVAVDVDADATGTAAPTADLRFLIFGPAAAAAAVAALEPACPGCTDGGGVSSAFLFFVVAVAVVAALVLARPGTVGGGASSVFLFFIAADGSTGLVALLAAPGATGLVARPAILSASSAFLFFEAAVAVTELSGVGNTGLVALAVLAASGLVARPAIPGGILGFGNKPGALGDVARFARTECPPMPKLGMGDPSDFIWVIVWPGAGEPVRLGMRAVGRAGDAWVAPAPLAGPVLPFAWLVLALA